MRGQGLIASVLGLVLLESAQAAAKPAEGKRLQRALDHRRDYRKAVCAWLG